MCTDIFWFHSCFICANEAKWPWPLTSHQLKSLGSKWISVQNLKTSPCFHMNRYIPAFSPLGDKLHETKWKTYCTINYTQVPLQRFRTALDDMDDTLPKSCQTKPGTNCTNATKLLKDKGQMVINNGTDIIMHLYSIAVKSRLWMVSL